MLSRDLGGWRLPAVVSLLAFAVYVLTASHVHQGDTPVYVEQIRNKEWLAWQHMLPHVIAGRALGLTDHYWPGLGTYPVLCTLDAATGAAAVGLLCRLVLRWSGSAWTAALAALALAASNTFWQTATTYELALFPLIPLLAAALLATGPADQPISVSATFGVGALVALAMGCHTLAAGTLPAWMFLLATQPGPRRDRAAAVAVFLAVFLFGTLLLYQSLLSTVSDLPGRTVWSELDRSLQQAATPDGDDQPAWFAVRGLGAAILAPRERPVGGMVACLWLAVLAVGSFLRRRALWARYGAWSVWPAAWIVGVLLVAIRVEPGNAEYYVQPIAAALCWTAMLVTVSPVPAWGQAALGGFALALIGVNAGPVWGRHTASPVHTELRAGPGGPVHPPPSNDADPTGPRANPRGPYPPPTTPGRTP